MSFADPIPAHAIWRARLRVLVLSAVVAISGVTNSGALAAERQGAHLVVSQIVFSGNTVITSPQLLAGAAPFLGRALTDADLQGLLQRLTDLYLQAGFSTSRAILPDQDTAGGVLHIDIVEGFLEQIAVSGTRTIDPAYIAARLQTGLTAPLNVAVLNANLAMLMQEPGLSKLNAELAPGRKRGGALLKVTVEEAARYTAGLRVANDRAPAVGGIRGVLDATARNVFNRGDEMDLTLGLASGLRDLDVRVSVPWSSAGPEFSVRYFRATSELVEEQFEVFGAKTTSSALDFSISQALWSRPRGRLKFSAGVVGKQSQSSLNGQLFSFSPGVENGKATVRLVRLTLQWQQQFARDSFSARAAWSVGLGALGATTHNDGLPDSRFHSGYLQLQWLHSLGPRAGSLFVRGEAQLTSDSLLPLEKFSLGGSHSVRGYRRSRFVRDEGWAASVEYRLPLLRLAVPGLSRRARDGQLSAVLFIDAGRAWNHDRDDFSLADPPTTLLAAGPGLRWEIASDTAAEIMWGGVRRHVANTGRDIQDRGVHFMVTAQRSF